MKRIVTLTIAVVPVLLVLGCGSKELVEEELTAQKVEVTQKTVTPTSPSTPQREDVDDMTRQALPLESSTSSLMDITPSEPAIDPLQDPTSLLAKRKIYFDFDRSEIKDEFREVIQVHANYLADHPEVTIRVEGHCDERGTREYNLALGERRARAVEQLLTLQGANSDQVRIVSFGEERPEVEGHDEFAWQMNRRALLIYPE